ncbi:VOC family protein [Tumebacillus flagellatus]|uniref:Glyoxalase/fosfomycin resistance/dioxygenase domain-containing protein n=1 Tax=Tumebacillus flagellatus TaxID=1157490 RepID=A0A074LQ22_9BACL|nr:VOC family protein [Tumebacillus flagellatus]KEO84236.1 hypothetical protein EL26_05580 [Tumebacillus flagellatus]
MPAKTPIQARINNTFIPVRDIEKARAWYNTLFGLDGGEIVAGHLYFPQMDGDAGFTLDTMPVWIGQGGEFRPLPYPSVSFWADDIEAAYAFMQEHGIELVTGIENGHWFVFKDLDGNHLMVCSQ